MIQINGDFRERLSNEISTPSFVMIGQETTKLVYVSPYCIGLKYDFSVFYCFMLYKGFI